MAERFGGRLYEGAHDPNGKACLHEALNVYQGREWSDDTTGTLDLRSLNDARWSSDEARTAAMLPLGSIVLTWPTWSPERRQAWAKAVAEGVIRRILPPTLRKIAELVPDKAPDLVAAAQGHAVATRHRRDQGSGTGAGVKPQTRTTLSLLRGFPEGLTSLEALHMGAGFRLSGRILELRQDGFDIETTWETTMNGARVARYVLREKPEQLSFEGRAFA